MVEANVKSLSREEIEAEVLRLRAQVAEIRGVPFGHPLRSTPAGHDVLLSAVEKTRMPMILTDPNRPDDPIIFANRAFQELSGYSSDELVGRNCRFLQGPGTDPAQVQRIRDALADKRDVAVDLLNYRRDGTPFLNELYISPVLGPDGRVLYHFGSQLDVTGFRRDRRELDASERRQRAIFDSAVDFAIVVTDRDGRVTDWNSGAARVLGWTAEEMVGEPVERIFTPADRAAGRAAAEMRQALGDGRAGDERWHVRADGSRFWASDQTMPLREADGAHAGFIKILRDRTGEYEAGQRLREAEERVRASEDHLRHTVELSPQVAWTCDPQGRIDSYSPRWLELTGQAPGEPYGAGWAKALHPDDVPPTLAAFAASLASGEPVDVEYRVRVAPTGDDRWMRARAHPRRNEAGAIVRWYGTVEDVHDRKLAEARLRRAQEAGGVGLFTVDLADDVLEPTPEFCRLYGLPVREHYPAQAFAACVVPEDAALVSTPEGRTRGELRRDVEYRIRRADTGDLRWIARKGEIETDEAGRPVRFVGAARDVTEQRSARDALAWSEERYRALFDAIDEGFCIIEFFDGPHGPLSDYVHVEANSGYERHTGIPDIVGQRLRTLAPAEADGWAELYGGVLRTGQPIRFERYFATAKRHIEVSAARVEPPSRRQVSVLFRDVTARKAAEAALRGSEARFRAFAQAVPNHIWSAEPDGRLDWVNESALSYGGTDPGDNTGEGWLGLVHPDDVAATVERWRAALASGTVYEAEFRLRRADGVYRWHLARAVPTRGPDGAIERWIGTNTDIEEQKGAAEVLAREAATLGREVTERTRERDRTWALSPVLKVVATAAGAVQAVNPAWTACLGWGEDEVLGRNVLDFMAPEDRATGSAALARLTVGEPVRDLETVFATKGGGRRIIVWTTVPEDGRLYGFGRDITDQRQVEEALRQSQKMEAVGQLTGGIAHDFNNLLTGITGSLELLGARIRQGRISDVERYTAAAQGAAKRAAALTHRLLAFSRRQTLDPKPTDVNRLVAGMEDLVRRTVGPAIGIETVAAVGLWPTLVDPSQLENALLNLCINARDAMPDGGRITVETANRWMDRAAAETHGVPAGQYISLAVTDTGTGMPPEVVARAFEPFFTTKPLGTGTGLGLSMIYGFAQQSGGHARIYSEVGRGTSVCLYLPRSVGPTDVPDAAPGAGAAPRAVAGETVLVVDDEPSVRMLVADTLEDLGYAAIEAGDGPSGLRVLQSDARVDLLVTDVGLPGGMNGRQMADAARARRPGLKVLFITGYAENAVMGNGQFEAGMHVLTKPFAMETLASKIRELIAG